MILTGTTDGAFSTSEIRGTTATSGVVGRTASRGQLARCAYTILGLNTTGLTVSTSEEASDASGTRSANCVGSRCASGGGVLTTDTRDSGSCASRASKTQVIGAMGTSLG